jgi:hypothetical protein
MMRLVRAGLKALNNPLLSATGNLLLLITGGPIALAGLLAAIGWLASESVFFVIAVVLLVLEAAVLTVLFLNRPPREEPTEVAADDEDHRVFIAVESEVALAHEEALEMIKLLRAEWPHITVEGALVQTALPDWRAKTTDFIGAALGSARRAAFKASAIGTNELERLESEGRFLEQLGLGLNLAAIRATEEEFLIARATRRTHEAAGFLQYEHHRAPGAPPPLDLRGRIDDLMRQGMEIVDEVSEPVVPEETSNGVWMISGGDAPDDWWDKADDFLQEARTLLRDHQPALLKDFEEGFNRKLRAVDSSRPVDPSRDRRTTSEKMLALADSERSNPRLIAEATLDGLTEARRRASGTDPRSNWVVYR